MIFFSDIELNIKQLKILFILDKGTELDKLIGYFENSDLEIRYLSLISYATAVFPSSVIEWINQKYYYKRMLPNRVIKSVYDYCKKISGSKMKHCIYDYFDCIEKK